jgi:hypothetical protein
MQQSFESFVCRFHLVPPGLAVDRLLGGQPLLRIAEY